MLLPIVLVLTMAGPKPPTVLQAFPTERDCKIVLSDLAPGGVIFKDTFILRKGMKLTCEART